MVENVILDVCNFLKTKHVLIPSQNQWLKGCIACYRESSQNCTPNQLKEFVFSQWKLADLRDISAPSLPNNCKTAPKLVLPGKYAIQINYAVNVGESFYKQLQKIRRPTAEENLSVDSEKDKTNEISASRTLKLEITDGVITLLGFEDKLIRKLVEPFVPGVKAVLSGPIECRKGVLFLKNENIDILGGEVDTLHIPNAVENVLARALGQDENPDPYKSLINNEQLLDDDDDFLQIPDEIVSSLTSTNQSCTETTTTQSRSTNVSKTSRSAAYNLNQNKNSNTSSNVSTFSSSSRDISNSNLKYSSSDQTRSVSTYNQVANSNNLGNESNQLDNSVIELDDDEEFLLMAAETATLAEQTVKPNKTPPNSKQTSLDKFFSNTTETALLKSVENKKNVKHSKDGSKNKTQENTAKRNLVNDSASLRAALEESYSDFMNIDNNPKTTYTSVFKKDSTIPKSENHCKDSNLKDPDTKIKVDKKTPKNITSEVISFPPKKYPCTQIIRSCVETISEKLRIYDSKWTLSAIVKIKGVEMEVDFSSDALDKIFGISATELQARRKDVNQDPVLKKKLNDVLKTSQKKIQQLDCDMEIHFLSYIAKPVILRVLD